MREIKRVVVHCTDSEYGDRKLIEEWHKARGFSQIGYHFLILNAYPTQASFSEGKPQFMNDGELIVGRPLDKMGAHCLGYNEDSVGISLVGKRVFSLAQIVTLSSAILKHGWLDLEIKGHYEYDSKKSCPNINGDWLRSVIAERAAALEIG